MRRAILAMLVLGAAVPAESPARGRFDDCTPAACVIPDGDPAVFRAARAALVRSGARIAVSFPPDVLFGRFPAGVERGDIAGLPVVLLRDAGNLSALDAPRPTIAAVRALLAGRFAGSRGEPAHERQPVSALLPTPATAARAGGGAAGDRSPSETARRFYQNSEILYGTVLVNLVFPESEGDGENWTIDEIGLAVAGVAAGLDELREELRWVDLEFVLNYDRFIKVPVADEPIETGWESAPRWIAQAMTALGFAATEADVHLSVHEFNEGERVAQGADWVFAAFIVDQSAHHDPDAGVYDPGCWNASPVISWAMHGGPYCVVPFPACRLGYGEGFARSFVRELCHVFWALDENGMAHLTCDTTAGYLAVPNRNTEYLPCTEIAPCVMREVSGEGALTVCEWTMGQIGLADDDWNSIPDVLEVPPVVGFIDAPGVNPDTIYENRWVMGARIEGVTRPNANPAQLALFPGLMSDVTQRLVDGAWFVNGMQVSGLDAPPADGTWNESREDVSDTLVGFEPGLNVVRVEGRNAAGYRGGAERDVLFVGLRFFALSLALEEGSNTLEWTTSSEVFGADFEIERRDMTGGEAAIVLATVDTPVETGYRRNRYRFEDGSVLPGRRYGYRVVARFTLVIDGELAEYRFASRETSGMTIVPVGDGFVSSFLPNPATDRVVFTVNVPVEYQSSMDDPGDGGIVEAKTFVDIKVYDAAGRRVRTLYSRSRYGGLKTIVWDTRDHRGRPVAPGVYFVQVAAGGRRTCTKVVVMR